MLPLIVALGVIKPDIAKRRMKFFMPWGGKNHAR